MKHSLARLAIVAAAAACGCAPALAQSSVTVYGIADMYVQLGRANGQTTSKVESGGTSGSRLGFRGEEDLGGGTKALFTLESGIGMDNGGVTQSGIMWGRQAWVGLQSTSFGRVSLGRQYSLLFTAIDAADPYGTSLGSIFISGIMTSLGGSRLNNAVTWYSPKFGPVSVSLQGALGEGATGRQWLADVRYSSGPLTVDAAYTRKQALGNQVDAQAALLTSTYDFGSFKLFGELQRVQNQTLAVGVNDNRLEYFFGAQMPFGPHRLTAAFGSSKVNDVPGSRASELSLGYQYSLSKRTELYTIASAINNGSATAYTANGATGLGPATVPGQDVRAVQVGIRHRF